MLLVAPHRPPLPGPQVLGPDPEPIGVRFAALLGEPEPMAVVHDLPVERDAVEPARAA